LKSFKQHWYTIRKIANYWFNLNSLLKKPQLISDTYLSILLAQLETDGYSIFVVDGELNKTQADIQLYENPLNVKQVLASYKHTTNQQENDSDNEDNELKKALQLSLMENDKDLDLNRLNKGYPNALFNSHDQNDHELNKAIQLSLMQTNENNPTTSSTHENMPTTLSPNTIRKKRLEHFEQNQLN
jgi:hypothetical protein